MIDVMRLRVVYQDHTVYGRGDRKVINEVGRF